MDFPGSTSAKEPPANAGNVRDTVSIHGLGRSPGEGMATHSSILVWKISWRKVQVTVHGVAKSWT